MFKFWKQKLLILLVFALILFLALYMGPERRRYGQTRSTTDSNTTSLHQTNKNKIQTILSSYENSLTNSCSITDQNIDEYQVHRITKEEFLAKIASDSNGFNQDKGVWQTTEQIFYGTTPIYLEITLPLPSPGSGHHSSFFSLPKKWIMLSIVTLIGIVAVFFMISSTKESVEVEMIKEQSEAMQRLARGLAHEIKNPLNAMTLSLDLMADSEAEEQLHYQEILRNEITRLSEIITRFMDFSGNTPLICIETDMQSILKEVVHILTPLFREKQLTFHQEVSESPCNIEVDPQMIRQVFLNLLKNAIEAAIQGTKIHLSCTRKKQTLQFTISNEGDPIPSELQTKIFEYYFTTRSKGNGIGLALCKKIIEMHNGTIQLNSQRNKTSFIVTLPVKAKKNETSTIDHRG